MTLAPLALGGSLALDGLLGEPPDRLHPVAWFGRVVPDRQWRRPRAAGVCLAVGLPALAALSVGTAVAAAGLISPLAAALAGALALFVSTSLRRLLAAGYRVVTLSTADVDAARDSLLALAGRDAADLSPGQLRSAAVESLAENLVDGLVAPLAGYAALVAVASRLGASPTVALAAGCAGAAWVKGVNTLDSMLGYRDRPVGWGAARLDDAVMWAPARLSALLLAVVAGRPGALWRAREWLSDVPSPNSGWPMGTLAAVLDVCLEKPGLYTLNPGGQLPETGDSRRALWHVAAAGLLAYALAAVVTWS